MTGGDRVRSPVESAAEVRKRIVRVVAAQMGIHEAHATVVVDALRTAGVWSSARSLRALDRYLASRPDALATYDAHCPLALVRLAFALHDTGHGVDLPRCVVCGKTNPRLTGRVDEGRCCDWCRSKSRRQICARCGELGHPTARRLEGMICRRCYATEPERAVPCADCGKYSAPYARDEAGQARCENCARPRRVCVSCGRLQHVKQVTPAGPLCQVCHQREPRPCGRCGRLEPVVLKAREGRPDLCRRCAPEPAHTCRLCATVRPVHVHWPIGPVCRACSRRAIRTPRLCASCHQTAVLVGRTTDGDACGLCTGAPEYDYRCHRCMAAGEFYYSRTCMPCSRSEMATRLLSGDDGTVPPWLDPLLTLITNSPRVDSTMRWLQRSTSTELLHEIARLPRPVTHADLDTRPATLALYHLRAVLVHCGVLAPRQEPLGRLEAWLEHKLKGLPPGHAAVISPYARWSVLRRARRRAARRHYSVSAGQGDRRRISEAIRLLRWLHQRGRTLADLTQADLDRHLRGDRNRAAHLTGFITWARHRELVDGCLQRGRTLADLTQADLDRHLRGDRNRAAHLTGFITWARHRELVDGCLVVPLRQPDEPIVLADVQDHDARIRTLLADPDASLETQVAGLLVMMLALPLTRIQRLTTSDLYTRDGVVRLALADHPVPLPSVLAERIARLAQIAQNKPYALVPGTNDNRWLLPSPVLPGTHLCTRQIAANLHKAGIPVRASRHLALLLLAERLPAPVLAELLGLSQSTAAKWAIHSQTDWADYLAARTVTRDE